MGDLLDDLLRWLGGTADQLGHAAADTCRLADLLERCWPDSRGQEWVERAGLVHRQLDRDAVTCATLRDRVCRVVEDLRAATDPEAAADLARGPLLGSTAARRADAARGVRIATLSDDPDGAR